MRRIKRRVENDTRFTTIDRHVIVDALLRRRPCRLLIAGNPVNLLLIIMRKSSSSILVKTMTCVLASVAEGMMT